MDEDPWTAKKEQGKDSRYQGSAAVLTPGILPPLHRSLGPVHSVNLTDPPPAALGQEGGVG